MSGPDDGLFVGPMLTGEILREAGRRADWDLVRGIYTQVTRIVDDSSARFLPDSLMGYLAEAMGWVAANYHGEEEEFVLHMFAVLANVEDAEDLTPKLFQRLYDDDRFGRFKQYGVDDAGGGTRRRPCPFETVVESARRYRDANTIQSFLGDSTAGILGGSTSYGRFFNVAGRRDRREPSDLDLIVVVPSYGRLDRVIDDLRKVDGISHLDLDAARQRVDIFSAEGFNDGHTIFSHRIRMWSEVDDPVTAWSEGPATYGVSLHVLSQAVLDWLLVRNAPKLDENHVGRVRSILDYRERTSVDDHDTQRSFSGGYRTVATDFTRVEGGWMRRSGVYSIHEGRYYPGMFQNLVFPRFDLRWDQLGARGSLEAFRYKMIERLRLERMLRPYELLLFSLAHTRSEVFAPEVLRRIDGAKPQ